MRLLIGLATVALTIAPPIPACAQVMNPLVPATSGGAVDITKPFLDGSEFGTITSIVRPTVFIGLGERSTLVARVPLVIATSEGQSSSTTLGNVDVGIDFHDENGVPRGSLSVILPTAQEFGDDDYATGVGILSDVLHAERYSSELWSAHGTLTPTRPIDGGMIGMRIGGSVWVPKGDGDTEFLARYGAFLSHTSGSALFGLELEGVAIVSESDLSASERTMHEIGGSIGLALDRWTPELFVRVPIDGDVRDYVSANVGLRVTF